MDYVALLRAFGLKATPQRVAILEILGQHTHPNMDELYEQIHAKHKSISQATIYKNINTMLESGVIIELAIPSERTRYDIYAHEHIHLICQNCKSIVDIDCISSKLDAYSAALARDFAEEGELENVFIQANLKSCKKCNNA